MALSDDLAALATLVERAWKARPQRGRAASADEIAQTLGALKGGAAVAATPSTDAPAEAGPLAHLRRSFGLSRVEAELLLIAVAPELEPRFRRVYGYLLDNLNRERAPVSLALELIGAVAGRAALDVRALLGADAPLRALQLLTLTGGAQEPLSGRELTAPERVVRAAAGADGTIVDDALVGLAALGAPGVALAGLKSPPAATVARAFDLLVAAGAKTPAGIGSAARPMVVLKGPPNAGKQHVGRALATALGRAVLVVDAGLLPKEPGEQGRLARLVVREALLHAALLYIDNADAHADLEGPAHPPRPLLDALRRYPDVVFLAGQRKLDGLAPLERDVLRLVVELPTPAERAQLWAAAIPRDVTLADDVDLAELSRKYGLGAGQIAAGAREAAGAARLRGEPAVVRANDLLEGARGQLHHRLTSVAERITRTYKWEDLILPDDVVEVLRELVGFAKHRQTVYEDLGFGGKHAYGRGVSALFSGPPGTGKTMVAGIMARELDMELFRIDLSRVVSKWIGETEKNLGRVFDEAALSHAIILFDEADSLFAKRTEVKSSVDRYANLEVNYLLQRMEAYEGVSILTTNFEDTIDEAFKRRLNFRIEFPFPEVEDREKLWPIMLPKQLPRAEDIDWHHLAKRFELSGGNIRNAVLRAAFYSVEEKRPVDLDLLERAAVRESEEMGKLVHSMKSVPRRR
jgi:SpoVK/Ycf46/Vps4 family AAA+-type ATPase